ncbi:DUF742 domain-containing protein [Streptomyces sp. NPDC001941]|uniref:DUF742 domain-containing protein n=1 Tax=Streptomyces sp. NPDC001941 TaxID=3154659 RepID=UPI003333AE61
MPAQLRPYLLTRGRTRATRDLAPTTLVTARPAAQGTDLGVDGPRIQLLCAAPTSVAELAGLLAQPLPVVKIRVDDLLTAHALVITQTTDVDHHRLLEAVLAGLRRAK